MQYLRSTVVFFGFEQSHSATTAPATIKASLVTLHTPVDVLWVFGLCKEYGCHCRGEEDSVIGWSASRKGGGHVLRRMAVLTFAAVMREHGGSVGRLLAHIRRLEAADCGSPARHWGLRGWQGSGNEGQSHQQASQKDYAERNEVS